MPENGANMIITDTRVMLLSAGSTHHCRMNTLGAPGFPHSQGTHSLHLLWCLCKRMGTTTGTLISQVRG